MTRLAIGEGAEYVPIVRRSHELWREIERHAGVELMTQTGGLVLGPPTSRFLAQTLASARQYGIAHDRLSAAQLADRFPMFAFDRTTPAFYEPESGYVRPEAAVRAQLELAHQHGAVLRVGERVLEWRVGAEEVSVRTEIDTYRARTLVLCAGPWIAELFPEARAILSVYRQLQYWFPIVGDYEQLREMPVFIIDFAGEADPITHLDGFYGFPPIDGPDGGVKVATELYEQTTVPDDRQHPATRAEVDEMYERCIKPRLPWLGREPVRSVSCLYTSARGSRFVIDRHPEHEQVLIVSACSGHGFKHSAAIGEAIAQLIAEGRSDVDLGAFRLANAY
jgi:sarcosine oxidase